MNLEDKFNKIVIKEYRAWIDAISYPFGRLIERALENKGIEVVSINEEKYDAFRNVWRWSEYASRLANRYYHGAWRPRNKRNKAINPWLELGHAMLKKLRAKGWDIRER